MDLIFQSQAPGREQQKVRAIIGMPANLIVGLPVISKLCG